MTPSAFRATVLLAVGLMLAGCGGGYYWREEVAQPDGKIITVSRSVRFGYDSFAALYGIRPIVGWTVSIPLPDSGTAVWEGDGKLTPMILTLADSTAYMAFTFYNCFVYEGFDSPKPPYYFAKYESGYWRRITVEEFPARPVNANLLTFPRERIVEKGRVSADDVLKGNRGFREEFVVLKREPPWQECST